MAQINPSALHRYAQFQRYSFSRDPAWRWQRINFLNTNLAPSGNPRRCSTHDDGYIREAKPLIHAYQQLAPEQGFEFESAMWKNPHLFNAYELNRNAAVERETPLFIQARLLAGQTDEQIAKIMGLTPETIGWYEALFFDVRHFLQCRDWVTIRILVPALTRTAPPEDASPLALNLHDNDIRDDVMPRSWLDGSLKIFAYFGGPVVVDIMLAFMRSGSPCKNKEEFPNWIDGNFKDSIRKRSTATAMQFRINKYNVMQLFEAHTRLMELEVSNEASQEQRSNNERTVKAMLDEIPWALGDDGEERFKGTKLGAFDSGAAELRDHEVIRVATGEYDGPTNIPLCLPPPRKSKVDVGANTEDL